MQCLPRLPRFTTKSVETERHLRTHLPRQILSHRSTTHLRQAERHHRHRHATLPRERSFPAHVQSSTHAMNRICEIASNLVVGLHSIQLEVPQQIVLQRQELEIERRQRHDRRVKQILSATHRDPVLVPQNLLVWQQRKTVDLLHSILAIRVFLREDLEKQGFRVHCRHHLLPDRRDKAEMNAQCAQLLFGQQVQLGEQEFARGESLHRGETQLFQFGWEILEDDVLENHDSVIELLHRLRVFQRSSADLVHLESDEVLETLHCPQQHVTTQRTQSDACRHVPVFHQDNQIATRRQLSQQSCQQIHNPRTERHLLAVLQSIEQQAEER